MSPETVVFSICIYIILFVIGVTRIYNELLDNKLALGFTSTYPCPRAFTKRLARKTLLLPLFPFYTWPMLLFLLIKAFVHLIKTTINGEDL